MGVALPTQFVFTNDLISARHSLATMFAAQNETTGALPYSGPPLSLVGSDPYHAWTLIGVCECPLVGTLRARPYTYRFLDNYCLYTDDVEWVQSIWTNFTKAVAYLEAKVDPELKLMDITGPEDWARLGGGGISSPGNALLYHVRFYAIVKAGTRNRFIYRC
jgi:hypothetical protein